MIASSPDCNLHNEKSPRFHYGDFACNRGGIKSHSVWKRNFSQRLFLLGQATTGNTGATSKFQH